MQNTRIETDSMGPMEIPADKYYGAQTARSLHFFRIGEDLMPLPVIHALAIIKKASAMVNRDLGLLSEEKAALIISAAEEVAEGKWDSHFPLSIWQTGSGTQTNMNVNEVIANRANEIAGEPLGAKKPIHPNNDVNMSQSSNDAFPAAMHIAAVTILQTKLLPSLDRLHGRLCKQSEEFSSILKIGRTHLMDAVPITLGQEFSGYAAQIDQAIERISLSLIGLYELALGGTAVGTGLNCPAPFAHKVATTIAQLVHQPFTSAPNKFAALASHEPFVFASGALKALAAAFMKMANDIRWMASGPRCGLQEITLPENEPGSSIMPGKVNPTQCEALTMISVQVMGIDSAIGFAAAQGNFELNVFKPVIIYNFLHAAILLAEGCDSFAKHALEGLKPNLRQLNRLTERSLMLVTALSPKIGYDKAAKIAHHAYHNDISLKEAAINLQALSEEEFDALMQPEAMLQPFPC
jgi:fumarate hydratase class II